MNDGMRLIEDRIPIKEIGIESAREKYIREGHISTIHIWWARRPLGSSRTTNYAALIPYSENEEYLTQQRDFLIKFSKWEESLNLSIIQEARNNILKNNSNVPPKILDPFGGGGAIPLEALRIGCETFSNDYNPVAVLIQKSILEYPQRYNSRKDKSKKQESLLNFEGECSLAKDVRYWGNWMYAEARKDLFSYYPEDPDGKNISGIIWTYVLPCQNPSCGMEIPLLTTFWISKKEGAQLALYPKVNKKEIQLSIVGDKVDKFPENFSPDKGTIATAIVECPACGAKIDGKTTKRLFVEKTVKERMVFVVLTEPDSKNKSYRLANAGDNRTYQQAKVALNEKVKKLKDWIINPIPDEPTPEGKGRGAERAFSIRLYGINIWSSLHNDRQLLTILTFIEKIHLAYDKMVGSGIDAEYAKAVCLYLAFGLDRFITYCNKITRWRSDALSFERAFDRQTIQLLWDFSEINPFSNVRGRWDLTQIINVINNCAKIPNVYSGDKKLIPTITQASATSIPYPDNFFDGVFTDPPYYDNVPYSYLSDFFYVWLKRSIGHLFPEFFTTPLTPKKNEIVAYSLLPGGFEAGKQFFEDMLKKAFQEIYRVLKPNGIVIIVYAHKSSAGWETLINSLLDSGLIITAAWPINTEMKSRLRAKESAALASSIYIVARKMERKSVGFYNTVKNDLKIHLDKKLDLLWKEGISGADFFISAIGSAIEVYGKYEKVMDFEGNAIRADKLLDDVQNIATDYAVKQILHNGYGREISDLTRFYVVWRWNFGNSKVIFDEARKLAQSCNISLEKEWNRDGFIKKDKESISVLGPHERKEASLKSPTEMIDVLHKVLLLWESSKKDEMIALLKEIGLDKNEVFFRVAQAISETLPLESKEKKLLEGFLAGRERLQGELKKEQGKPPQKRLFK
jgi:adenine-specific DNA methylase